MPKPKTTQLQQREAVARQGDAEEQFNLGMMHYNGDGVAKDHGKAAKWFHLAAEQGLASAQFNLGFMYEQGKGVAKDQEKAIKWYRLGAEQGDASAQNNLGFMYGNGHGIAKDREEAFKWFRLAAEQGSQRAIKTLSENEDFSASYHAAMLEMDEDAVIKLLSEKKSISEALLFDVERSVKNHVLFEAVLSIVHRLNEKGINTYHYQLTINNVYIQKILAAHQEKSARFELYDAPALASLYSTLAKINFYEARSEQIQPLFNLLIDSWYAATNGQMSSQSQITSETANYLSQLIYKLNSQPEPEMDSHVVLQCILILIKHHFGNPYEVAFRSATLNDLTWLLALVKSNQSAKQINQIFGKDIIIEVNFNIDQMKSVITQLAAYLKGHPDKISTSPYLASLNRCLIESSTNLKDEHSLRNTLTKILVSTSEYQSAKKAMNGNSLFAIKDVELKEIYRLLKRRDINGLAQFLETRAEKPEADDLASSPSV